MLAIIDHRSPPEAIENLKKITSDVLLFGSENITYNSISGHPDIFIFQDKNNIIIAPNSPDLLINFLEKHKINFRKGEKPVGNELDNSVQYNCVLTDKYFFHKKDKTDKIVLENNIDKKFINLPQAYTRCSMINLSDNIILHSDKGIKKALDKESIENFYFSPEEIKIKDHKNGFFGGTCGIFGKRIFFNGNIDKHKDGKELRIFLSTLKYEIISLHDDYLYDGGGIFFISEK